MRKTTSLAGLVALIAVLAPAAVAQEVLYGVTVDTRELSGITGFLDFQFNPGGADALAANVFLSNIRTDGQILGATILSGDASGQLPGPPYVSINNTTTFNDAFQRFRFGDSLHFNACFSGPALAPQAPTLSGTTFSFSLYAPDGTTPLLTSSIDGSLLHIEINPAGSTEAIEFADVNGNFHTTVAFWPECVPEPGSLSLFAGSTVCGVFLWRRRIRNSLNRV